MSANQSRTAAARLFEQLEPRRFLSSTVAATAPDYGLLLEGTDTTPEIIAPRRVFLTGNSMTDGVNYLGLMQLLERDGASVSLGRQTGPGFTQLMNYNLTQGLFTSGYDPARPGVGNPWGNYVNAFPYGWDVLTLQPHDRRLLTDIHNWGTPGEADEAEIPATMNFIRAFAENNASGQVFIYSRSARRNDVLDDMTPTGEVFDYSVLWERTYIDQGADRNNYFISRSYVQQFMPLLLEAQDADEITASMKDVRLIPVGEVYYEIDQAIKAGKFEGTGVTSLLDFYKDQSHPSDDLGAYAIALTFYSSITGNVPQGVAPTSAYLTSGRLANLKLQQLIQQAVYDAMTRPEYAGWTTPLPAISSLQLRLFEDVNGNGQRDGNETGVAGLTVFLDADNDGIQDTNEPSAVSDAAGLVRFDQLVVGVYTPRLATADHEPVNGQWAAITVTEHAPASVELGYIVHRADSATGSISGVLWNDGNGNGVFDPNESRTGVRVVFIDLNGNKQQDPGEPAVSSDENGNYVFTGLTAGTYRVTRVFPKGYWMSNSAAGYLTIELAPGQTVTGANIGTTNVGTPPTSPTTPPPSPPVVDPTPPATPPATPTGMQTVEAESGTMSGGTFAASNHSGFTGTGFADYAGQGSAAQWQVNWPSAGTATLTFRYANGSNANRPLSVEVNGVVVGTVAFAPTGGWTNWGTASLTISLREGANTIRAVASTTNGGANVDSLTITPADTPPVVEPTPPVTPPATPTGAQVFEAESGTRSGGTVFTNNHSGFTGTGFADYAGQGSAVQWQVNWPSAGTVTLTFRYANGSNADRPLSVEINGVVVGTVACVPTGGWTNWGTASLTISLREGANTIRAVASTTNGGANVDSLTITPTTTSTPTPPPPAGDPTPPVTPPTGTASIRGYVVNDVNRNGKWDSGEVGIVGRTVWIDLNDNGLLDANEPTLVTGNNGVFVFSNLAAGTYRIREVVPAGSKQYSPTSSGALTITVSEGQLNSGKYFAVGAA